MLDQPSCVRLECQPEGGAEDNDQRVIFSVFIAQHTGTLHSPALSRPWRPHTSKARGYPRVLVTWPITSLGSLSPDQWQPSIDMAWVTVSQSLLISCGRNWEMGGELWWGWKLIIVRVRTLGPAVINIKLSKHHQPFHDHCISNSLSEKRVILILFPKARPNEANLIRLAGRSLPKYAPVIRFIFPARAVSRIRYVSDISERDWHSNAMSGLRTGNCSTFGPSFGSDHP